MKYYSLLLLALPFWAKSQFIKDRSEADPDKLKIEKNLLRVLGHLSTDTRLSLTGNYEREIIRPFTVSIMAGPAISKDYIGKDISGTSEYKWLFNLMANSELRYYYNLTRRAKSQKTVRNFSAFYLSLEEQLVSKPLLIINETGNEEVTGSGKTFFNVGYQFQKYKTYYNIFFGTRFPGKIYSNVVSGLDLLHAGIGIGRVF